MTHRFSTSLEIVKGQMTEFGATFSSHELISINPDGRGRLRVVESEDRIVLTVTGVVDDAAGSRLAEAVRLASAIVTPDQTIVLDLTRMERCTVEGMRRLATCAQISELVRFRYG